MLYLTPDFICFICFFTALFLLGPNRHMPLLLAGSSTFFFSYIDQVNLIIVPVQVLVAYLFSLRICRRDNRAKLLLALAIIFNLLVLSFYKYFPNSHFGQNFNNRSIPLGISFYTFQIIAYLIDSYRTKSCEREFIIFYSFISFFPQLIAGPICRPKHLIPQLRRINNTLIPKNIARAITLISTGAFLKACLSDNITKVLFAQNKIMELPLEYTVVDTWIATILLGARLYGDFLGYSLMSIGIARFFNVRLPSNFNAPYLSCSIQEFWRRWHITLSSWLRDYLYVPLGGSRGSTGNTARNILITMVIGGAWHGSTLSFALWGGYHGILIVTHHVMTKHRETPTVHTARTGINWLITYILVNIGWVIFTLSDIRILVDFFGVFFAMTVDLEISTNLNNLNLVLVCSLLFTSILSYEFFHQKLWFSRKVRSSLGQILIFLITSSCIMLFGADMTNEFIYFKF